MKRVISLFLTLVLLLPCLVGSLAEENEQRFVDHLTEWLTKIDLSKKNYEGSIKLGEGTLQGTVAQDAGITEISIPGLGRAQLSGDKIALEINGQTIILDLQSVLKLFNSDDAGQDMENLRGLMVRAFQSIVKPYVETTSSSEALSIHVSTDEKELQNRLIEFVDRELADDKTVALVEQYLPLVHLLYPAVPETVDEFKTIWQIYKLGRNLIPQLHLNADLNIEIHDGQIGDITCFAVIDGGSYQYEAYSFNIQRRENGFTCSFTNNNGYWQSVYNLDFQQTENGFIVTGEYPQRWGNAISFDIKATNNKLTAKIWNGTRTIYTVTGEYENKSGSYWLQVVPSNESETVNITGIIQKNKLTARATYYRDVIQLSFTGDEKQGRFTLKSTSPYYNNRTYEIEIQYFKIDNKAYRIIISDIEKGGLYNGQDGDFYLNAQIRPDQIEFLYYPIWRPSHIVAGKLGYRQLIDGSSFEIEYCDPYNSELTGAYYNDTPFRLSVVKQIDTSQVEFSYPYEQFDVEGAFTIQCDGAVQNIIGDISTGYCLDPNHPRFTAEVSYTPGLLLITGDYGTYQLKQTEETADKMVWELTGDNNLEILFTASIIDDELCLTALQGEMVLGKIKITPTEKIELQPINNTNAVVLNAETILYLLKMMNQTY